MEILFAVGLLVFVLYKIFRDHLIIFHGILFLSKKQKKLEEAEIYRKDLTVKLLELRDRPLSQKEMNEWIKIARFNDEMSFSVLPKEFHYFEKLENMARRIFKLELK